jgi:hypothetical protein
MLQKSRENYEALRPTRTRRVRTLHRFSIMTDHVHPAVFAVWACVAIGCGSANPSQTRPSAVVPPIAPDSVPAGLYADSNLVSHPAYLTGKYIKDVIAVVFRLGATQAQRQIAVDTVSGIVIGGERIAADGEYLVRLPHDGTGATVFAAIELLESLPQVYQARVLLEETVEGPATAPTTTSQ